MTEEEGNKKQNLEGEAALALQQHQETLPAAEFVKVEKNLASLGFFTASSKRSRNATSKTVTVNVSIDGKRIEARATIAPTALFGLPITADQDKWLALHKILTDVQAREGTVRNPVSFTSAELLALLKIYKDSGKNYRDVSDWLDVMVGTTIISEGAVYVAGQRTFKKDTFHVFDRAVSFGRELPDGSIADKNYIWLSQWQLKNINDHHQLPIDLDSYRELRNHIAKALVPHLQIWLYATRDGGVFEKRYDELCQVLSIRQYQYLSIIKQTLGPSLDELQNFGYIAGWNVEKTSDGQSYKVIFCHGEKFHRDRRTRIARRQQALGELPQATHTGTQTSSGNFSSPSTAAAKPTRPHQQHANLKPNPEPTMPVDPELVSELGKFGIGETAARQAITSSTGQPVSDKIEWAVAEIRKGGINRPDGFIIAKLKELAPVPSNFETRAVRQAREEAERKRQAEWDAEQARLDAEEAAEEKALDDLQANNPERYQTLYRECEKLVFTEFPSSRKWAEVSDKIHIGAVRARMKPLLREHPERAQEATPAPEEQGSDPSFLLKLVALPPATAGSLSPAEPAEADQSAHNSEMHAEMPVAELASASASSPEISPAAAALPLEQQCESPAEPTPKEPPLSDPEVKEPSVEPVAPTGAPPDDPPPGTEPMPITETEPKFEPLFPATKRETPNPDMPPPPPEQGSGPIEQLAL